MRRAYARIASIKPPTPPAFIKQTLLDQEAAATSGNVYGYDNSSDTLVAGAGDKYLNGINGQDTYVYSASGGNDIIEAGDGLANLVFSGIASTDVTMSRVGASNDLVLTVGSTGKTVTIRGQFNWAHVGQMSSIAFSDGVTWSPAFINQSLLDQEAAAASGNVYGYDNSSDTLVAGAGDKYLNGVNGQDTYVYSASGGNDIIEAGDSLSNLVFSGIASTDVTMSRVGASNDLVLTVGSTGKTVTIRGQFNWAHVGQMSSIGFSDGVTWSPAFIKQTLLNQEAAATSGNVYGYDNSNDTLVAGVGDKYLNGINGQDTYVYSSASGNDVIDDQGNAVSTLHLSDIASTGVTLSRPSGGNNLVMSIVATGKTVTVNNEFSASGQGSLSTIVFSDGVSWNKTQILNILAGGTAGSGSPPGVTFHRGDGQVTVSGSTGIINFGTGIAPGDVLLQSNGFGDLIFKIRGDDADGILVHNDLTTNSWGTSSAISQLNFINGTSVALGMTGVGQGTPITFTWVGTSTNTSLSGSNYGSNILEAGPGGDSITFGNASAGGDGKNTLKYAIGDGAVDVSVNGGTGAIAFGAGITAQDVYLQGNSFQQLTVQILGDATDRIVLHNDLITNAGTTTSSVNQLQFSDGSVINLNSGLTFTWLGNTSNYGLSGLNFASNIFDITAGNGSINFGNTSGGGDGKNTIDYARGSGIADVSVNGGTGVISFATGITAQDVYLQGNNFQQTTVLIRGDAADSIVLHNDLLTNAGTTTSSVNELKFSDGTVINLNPGLTFTWLGNTSNYSLNGLNFVSNAFEITGSNGNVTFGGGNNTIKYTTGTGRLDVYLNGGHGIIQFAAGISASDVLVQANNFGDMILKVRGDDADSIVVHNDIVSNSWGASSAISQLSFADGTTTQLGMTGAGQGNPLAFTWVGTSSNNSLTGTNYGSNIFEFGAGTETASGGSGNNTYKVSTSTGQASINANKSSGTSNELDFASGFTDDQLWFVQSGNDLQIDLIGTQTAVTIQNWFSGSSNQLQEITAGGPKIDSQVSQLVQAMATYSVANSGFDPTNSSIHTAPNDTSLQNSISAAWHA